MAQDRQQRRALRASRPQSPWMRLLAILCVALMCVASTAQVCHSHELLPRQKDSRQSVPLSDHCPLCTAMHSALPGETHHAPEVVLQMQPVFSRAVRRQLFRPLSFDLFSRPPPAKTSLA